MAEVRLEFADFGARKRYRPPRCVTTYTSMPIEATWFNAAADALAHAVPYGVTIIPGFVIRALWLTIKERDAIIATLQDKRASDAATSSKLVAAALLFVYWPDITSEWFRACLTTGVVLRRGLFGARFVDLLDRGSATLIASLLPIIRKGLRRSTTPVVKQPLSGHLPPR